MGHLLARLFWGERVDLLAVEDRQRITGRTTLLVVSILENIEPQDSPVVFGPRFIKPESNAGTLRNARLLGVRGELASGKIHRQLGVQVPAAGDPWLLSPDLLGHSHQGASGAAGTSRVAGTREVPDREMSARACGQ